MNWFKKLFRVGHPAASQRGTQICAHMNLILHKKSADHRADIGEIEQAIQGVGRSFPAVRPAATDYLSLTVCKDGYNLKITAEGSDDDIVAFKTALRGALTRRGF